MAPVHSLQPFYFFLLFCYVLFLIGRVLPLVVVLSVLESVVGIEITNAGCWCVLDFFNLRPDNGVSHGKIMNNIVVVYCCCVFVCCWKFIKEDNPFYKLALVHGSILGAVFVLTSVGIAVSFSELIKLPFLNSNSISTI